jgi:hypothetical protein
VISAARALLLKRFSNAPRNEWARLSSIRFIQARIGECEGVLQGGDIELIRRAGDHLLRRKRVAWDQAHYPEVKALLERVRADVKQSFSRRRVIKNAAWMVEKRRVIAGLLTGRADPLPALQLLIEAWGLADAPDRGILWDAAREVAKISPDVSAIEKRDPKTSYGRLLRSLQRYVAYFPNKLFYPRASG